MKRLSSNPSTVQSQIDRADRHIEFLNTILENTPLEDETARKAYQEDLDAEWKTRRKLQEHLDGLEDEFHEMGEVSFAYSNVSGFDE